MSVEVIVPFYLSELFHITQQDYELYKSEKQRSQLTFTRSLTMTHDHLETMGKIPLNQDRTTTTTTIVKNQQIRESGSYTFVQHIRSNFQNYNVLFSRSYSNPRKEVDLLWSNLVHKSYD